MPFNYTEYEAGLIKAGTAFNFVTVPDYGTVKFYELAKQGARLSYQGRVHRCERTFRVWPYDKSWGFCAWMVGWSRFGSNAMATNGGVLRYPPQPLPIFNRPGAQGVGVLSGPPKPFAWATEVLSHDGLTPTGFSFSPFDGTTLCGNFAVADIKIAYGSVPYRVKSDAELSRDSVTQEPDESSLARYVSRSYAPSGKHVQFPAGALRWEGVPSTSSGAGSQDQISTQTMGKVLPFTDVVYTWHEVPGIPLSVFSNIGTVNQYSFDGRPAETLLLVGVEITPHRQVTGDRAFDLAYRMKYFDVDGSHNHNYFFRIYKPDGTTYSDVRWKLNKPYYKDDVAAKHYVFEKTDFRDLFRGPFDVGWVGP